MRAVMVCRNVAWTQMLRAISLPRPCYGLAVEGCANACAPPPLVRVALFALLTWFGLSGSHRAKTMRAVQQQHRGALALLHASVTAVYAASYAEQMASSAAEIETLSGAANAATQVQARLLRPRRAQIDGYWGNQARAIRAGAARQRRLVLRRPGQQGYAQGSSRSRAAPRSPKEPWSPSSSREKR